MSCRRALDTDFEEFVRTPHDAAWGDLLDHYPSCTECSEAVAKFSEFERLLRSAATDSPHPDAERLLAFHVGRELEAQERAATRQHVESCNYCRSSLEALAAFDFAALQAPAKPASENPTSWLGEFIDALKRFTDALVARPAFAAVAVGAAVLVLSFAAFLTGSDSELEKIDPSRGLVEIKQEAPERKQEQIAQTAGEPRELDLEKTAPSRVLVETEQEAPERKQEQVAQIAAEPKQPVTPQRLAETSLRPLDSEPVLLAMVTLDLPNYSVPSGSTPGARTLRRLVRSAASELPKLYALVPDHIGYTTHSSPTLSWYVTSETSLPLTFTLQDTSAIDPLLEVTFEPPTRSGFHTLHLADHEVSLRSDVSYEWYVSISLIPEIPSSDVLSGGLIRRVAVRDDLSADLAEAPTAERGHVLAKNGIWYDALAFISKWSDENPDNEGLRRHRIALLEQAGIDLEIRR